MNFYRYMPPQRIKNGVGNLCGTSWIRLRSLCSNIRFDASDADVEEVLDKHLDKNKYRKAEDVPRSQIVTTRREALSLYREICRLTALFEWPNEQGVPWRDVLRKSARDEFEAARHETDPEIINRLLVVGRDSVNKVAENFAKKHFELNSSN